MLGIDGGGRVVYANSRAHALFGYGPAEAEATIPLESLLPGLGSVEPGGDPFEMVGRRLDGSGFAARVTISLADADERSAMRIVIVRDISVQRRVEEELRRTRDSLSEAQRLARLGSWEWNIPENEVTWSDELFKIFGLEPGSATPSYESFLARVHPDDRDSVDARNRKAFADHQPFEDVKRCTRADGTVFLMRTSGEVTVDEEGKALRMLGICEDVTAEHDAARAEAQLAAIVLNSADAIVSRTLAGVITSWNPAATQLYGFSEEEALGRHISLLIPETKVAEDETKLAMLLRGDPVGHFETQRRHKGGSLIDVSLGMSVVRDATGAIITVFTMGRDASARKQLEAENERLLRLVPAAASNGGA